MHKISLILLFLLSFCLISTGYAKTDKEKAVVKDKSVVYNLKFAKDSPVKDIDLNNKHARIQMFYHGNPIGLVTKEIARHPSITVDNLKGKETKGLVVDLLSIKGLKDVKCTGFAKRGKTDIELVCKKQK